MREKLEQLKDYLAKKERLAIGFSGGVDSAFLLKTAHEVLGENVTAITVKVRSLPMLSLMRQENFAGKREFPMLSWRWTS